MIRNIFAAILLSHSLVVSLGCSADSNQNYPVNLPVNSSSLFTSLKVVMKDDLSRDVFENLYVPAGEEWVFRKEVTIRSYGPIVVDGVLRGLAPERSSDPAPSMVLESMSAVVVRGRIHGFPGADGESMGADGGDAGALTLRAPTIITNSILQAGAGGDGGPAGGDGGTGGMITVAGFVVGPFYDDPEASVPSPSNVIGGAGGAGGPPMGSVRGGAGGDGGGARGELFREVPWMVEYREYYLLTDEEIAQAKARGEIR